MSSPLPRLRALEILHVDDDQGNPAFLLKDPLGYSDDEVLLSEAALFAASYMDGSHSMEDLRENFDKRYHAPLDPVHIEALVGQLDTAFFLENETFDAQKCRIETKFLAAPTRPATHAGSAYPKDPDDCLKTVTDFFEQAHQLKGDTPWPQTDLLGLVAPHIDLRAGGACTALAYQALSHSSKAETVVVLGTSHACMDPWMMVSQKNYETPLGTVPTNLEMAQELKEAAGAPPEAEVFHFKEHSIEFQAVFLSALRASGRTLSMVPVLCGNIRDSTGEENNETFWSTLKALLLRDPGKIVVIAAADLAHVGPRFGDKNLDTHHLKLLEKKDRDTLDIVQEGGAQLFYDDVMTGGDPRRICGLSPVFGLLKCLPQERQGRLLQYEQTTDDSGTVSYASMGFWSF